MKRKTFEISAGSMADIAFLLLIFFLVSTTIDKDKGYIRQMAANSEDPRPSLVNPEDVLLIQFNNSNQLMVENQFADIEQLKEEIRAFYLANSPLGKPSAAQPIWEKHEKHSEYLGLNKKAFINLHPQIKTDYKAYMEVQSAIQEVVYEVRDEISNYYFGASYKYLLEHKESEFEKINIVNALVPIRIMDNRIM